MNHLYHGQIVVCLRLKNVKCQAQLDTLKGSTP